MLEKGCKRTVLSGPHKSIVETSRVIASSWLRLMSFLKELHDSPRRNEGIVSEVKEKNTV